MEEHHHNHRQYEVVPDFGLAPTPCYPCTMHPADIRYVTGSPNSAAQHFDMFMMSHHHQNFQQLLQESDHQPRSQHHEMMMHNSNHNNGFSATVGGFAEANILDGGSGGGGGRWPRQETLTLLEIRSRLDNKFKEANHKGPLWDEISRIMSDEHGYQRSGKKCREKFENLYKYYKKTKDGKAGRQDGKHYRFFRQLEDLYGENKTNYVPPLLPLRETSHFLEQNCFEHLKNTPSCCNHANRPKLGSNTNYNSGGHHNFHSLSLSSNSSEFDTISCSEDYNDLSGTGVCDNGSSDKKRKGGRNWKAKIKGHIDSQMKRLVEKQEAWLAEIMKTIEQTEKERLLREEEWKTKEVERMDRERMFWANERQWIEARDANLMEALHKFKGGEVLGAFNCYHFMSADHIDNKHNNQWAESEITKLVQTRAGMELKFEQYSGQCDWGQEFVLWEEIANKMASLGINKSASMCKNKWESINSCLVSRNKGDFGYKKQKGDSSRISSSGCYGTGDHGRVEGIPVFGGIGSDQATHNFSSMSSSNMDPTNNSNVQQESFFRFLMVDHVGSENIWSNKL
uniref:Myb-like domain-containing protein n=1 Tax=Kalanchoe fedtschenkoi TaxID=63787 RepID=A0A7N0V5Q5_KALFE